MPSGKKLVRESLSLSLCPFKVCTIKDTDKVCTVITHTCIYCVSTSLFGARHLAICLRQRDKINCPFIQKFIVWRRGQTHKP